LKAKGQNISVSDLFRKNLENAEIIPGADLKSVLMHRVARKEFMRFNPVRLNMYYLGGIIITGITASVLLFSGSHKSAGQNNSTQPPVENKSDSNSYFEVPMAQPLRTEPGISSVIHKNSVSINKVSRNHEETESDYSKAEIKHQNDIPFAGINSSLSKNSLFIEAIPEKSKLQRGYKPEELLIEPHDSAGCAPLRIHFTNNSASYDSCRWTFGDGGYSNQKNPEWIFDVEGEYKVNLDVFRNGRKLASSSSLVTVHPKPQARFEIVNEKDVAANDEMHFLNYSINAVQFRWDFGDGNASDSYEPAHRYSNFGNYNVRLVVYSEFGCSDSVTVFNALSGSQYYINFPNAFIPNSQGPTGGYYSSKSDEAAQVFHPSFSGVSDYQLKIFSKLGIQIFETNDINIGWDGYNKGQLCEPGVYIWKVRLKFRNGEPFTKMGDVTLLKE
jgi:PKD repeat protein